jgi:CheY-like chemotaxis protein
MPIIATPVSPRVLIVDDDPVNCEIAYKLLSDWEVQVTIVGTGARALELVRELDFDLILMRLELPVVGSLSTTERIRSLERQLARQRQVPIVAYTTSECSPDEPTPRQHGITAMLSRPCSIASIRDCQNRWCPDCVRATHLLDVRVDHLAWIIGRARNRLMNRRVLDHCQQPM